MADMDGLDSMLSQIGITPWSVKFFITSSLIPALLPPNLIGGEFINPAPRNYSCIHGNGDQCYFTDDDNQTASCTQWIYNTTMFSSTIAMEWNLVCDRAYLQPFFQMIYTIGCLLGSVLGGYVANKFGRKVTIQIGTVMTSICSVFLSFAPDFPTVLVLRFILGVFNTIMVYPGFMLSMEICSPKLRSVVGVMLAIPYALMTITFALMAYYIRDWRELQLASCSFVAPLLVFTFLIDESPRWLLINGRDDEAYNVMKKACPKYASEHNLRNQIKQINEELSSKNVEKDDPWWSLVLSLFTHKDMRKITFIVMIIWFLQGIVYLGIPLNSDAFSSPFLYIGLMGVMELPAYTITAPITKRFGRKAVSGISLLVTGFSILFIVILNFCEVVIDGLNFAAILLAYLCICTSYQVNFITAPELFPTTLRPYGTALVNLVAYIGFSIPPLITDYSEGNLILLPPLIFGCCGLVSGILVFFLPETNGKPLMETLSDVSSLFDKDQYKFTKIQQK